MAGEGNAILEMLLGGARPDPQAMFAAQAFLEGKMPGDPVENIHTVLSMLPGRATMGGFDPGGDLGASLGLEQSEGDELIRQLTGLTTTPAQRAASGLKQQEFMLDWMQSQQDLGVDIGELEVKQAKEKRELAAAPTEKAHKEALTKQALSLVERRTADREMRTLLRAGVDSEGNPVTQEEQDIMLKLLGARSADPSQFALIRSLLESGVPTDREWGAKYLASIAGVDTTVLGDPPGFFDQLFKRYEIHLGPAVSIEELTGVAGPGLTPEKQRQVDDKLQKFGDTLVEELNREER